MTPSHANARARRAGHPRRLFLLDGHSLAYRAFFALPPTLATSSGTVTNAVYGFTSMLIKLLAEEKPDLIAVFFDSGAPTVRLAKDADYKAGRRETPQDFTSQLGLIEEVLDALRIPVLRIADGNEADDAIGTLALRASEQGIDATIVTADRDFFQLVRPGITVMFNRKGISDIVRYDEAAVTERYGITPAQYLDFVALKGDTSDNIPGVPGVGDKTAAKLVNQFGTVEELVATHRPAQGQAEGERRGQRRPAGAQQGARADRHRRRAAGRRPTTASWGSGTRTRSIACSPRWSSGPCSTGCRRSDTP